MRSIALNLVPAPSSASPPSEGRAHLEEFRRESRVLLSVLDALRFEERGLPGIALVTEPFSQTRTVMAATWGQPGFRFVEGPHPVAIVGDKETDDQADRLMPLG